MKKIKISLITTLAYLVSLKPVFAQIVGTLQQPGTVVTDVTDAGSFISVIVKFLIAVAGIWSLWQILTAGFAFITSNGDKGKVSEATNKINMAVTGLVVIGISFILTAIISQLVFGSFTYILNPVIETI